MAQHAADQAVVSEDGGDPWGTQGRPASPPPRRRPNGPGNRPPSGPWGVGPPEFEALFARARARFRGWPGGGGSWMSGRGVAVVVLALVLIWLASGFYRVQPDEQGVVLRFGGYERPAYPGLNYHLPWPIEEVERPAVTRINRIEIGYSTPASGSARPGHEAVVSEVPQESLMLTGDENIIDIHVAVFWRIRSAPEYLFDVRNPDAAVKSAAESAMRQVIGSTPIGPALTGARAQIETAVVHGAQTILDRYGAGVEITQVQLQNVDPPAAVIDSFRDVQRANTDADRMRNEAESYRNDIVPRARGDAARIVAEADGSRQAAIAEATGQAQRFESVLTAYQAAKEITLRRLYIETMQQLLAHTPTTVVDDRLKSILPLLPLNEPARAATPPTPTGTAEPAKPAAQ